MRGDILTNNSLLNSFNLLNQWDTSFWLALMQLLAKTGCQQPATLDEHSFIF